MAFNADFGAFSPPGGSTLPPAAATSSSSSGASFPASFAAFPAASSSLSNGTQSPFSATRNPSIKPDSGLETRLDAAALKFEEGKVFATGHQDKWEHNLFLWLGALEKALTGASKDAIKPHQAEVEKTLLSILALPFSFASTAALASPPSTNSPTSLSSPPRPTRSVRSLVARCFKALFTYGEGRNVFDMVVALQKELTKVVNDKDGTTKIAYISTLGNLHHDFPSPIFSLLPESLSLMLRILSITARSHPPSDPGLVPQRFESSVAITKLVLGSGRKVDLSQAKDILKTCREGLKIAVMGIRGVSAECWHAVVTHTRLPPPPTIKDLDHDLLHPLYKHTFESATYPVRRSTASLVASILTMTQQHVPTVTASTAGQDAVAVMGLAIGLQGMLGILGSNFANAKTLQARLGLVQAYASLFRSKGIKWVESNYTVLAQHVLETTCGPKATYWSVAPGNATAMWSSSGCARSPGLQARDMAKYLLREVMGKMMTEAGKEKAVGSLVDIVKKSKGGQGSEPTSKWAIIAALNEIAALVNDLGTGWTGGQDVVDQLIGLLNHPSHSVTISAAWTLRCVCLAEPMYLSKLVAAITNQLQRDSTLLASFSAQGEKDPSANVGKTELFHRLSSHSLAVACLNSIIPHRPLYSSFDLASRVFALSTSLLRSASSGKDYRTMGVQASVAWTLVGSIMGLGPQFVKVHLSQLLLVWKNQFPKPGPKDAQVARSYDEWCFLLESRGAALAALLAFLAWCGAKLVTLDVAKRIVVCLNNTVSFLGTLPERYPEGDDIPGSGGASGYRLVDREHVVRKRLFDCYRHTTPSSTYESMQPTLLGLSIEVFTPDVIEQPIQGTKEVVRTVVGKTMGLKEAGIMNGLVTGMSVHVAYEVDGEVEKGVSRITRADTDVEVIESQLDRPTIHAPEHDPAVLCFKLDIPHTSPNTPPDPHRIMCPSRPPPNIDVVDSAVEIFAMIFPLQTTKVQEQIIERLVKSVRAHLERDKAIAATKKGGREQPGLGYSVHMNVITALLGVLKYVGKRKGAIASPKVGEYMQNVVQIALTHEEASMRAIASETLGRLAHAMSTATFINPFIQSLIDEIVNNTQPEARAGAVLALGCTFSHVGGMAGASHLKTVVQILHTLSADPHPLVHTWALNALWLTVDGAGLMYGPYVKQTLSLVAKLYMAESHEPVTKHAMGNYEGNTDVYPSLARILNAIVGVLGPELEATPSLRSLVLGLYESFRADEDPFVMVEAIRCIQQLILFAPKSLELSSLIPFLQFQLAQDQYSQLQLLRKACVTCLYQLVQRDPGSVLENATSGLEEQLFGLLDTEIDDQIRDEIKDILIGLLKFVAVVNPSRWLDLCKKVLSKSGASAAVNDVSEPAAGTDDGMSGSPVAPGGVSAVTGGEVDDDENFLQVEHSDAQDNEAPTSGASTKAKLTVILLPRWKTHLFALFCLRKLIAEVFASGRQEHIDLALAREAKKNLIKTRSSTNRGDFLILRLNDLIRMAFAAATAPVNDLRLGGLDLLEDLLGRFGSAPDPDFEEHALLEQYQAQISAALNPAFSPDSPPEIMATACRVCASYIGSGINKDLSTLSRVLKLLTNSLERCKETSNPSTESVSPHATIMVKLAIQKAWAELHAAGFTHPYLKEVVMPIIDVLAGLWISTLCEYARLKLEGDLLPSLPVSVGSANEGASSTSMYMEATQDVILPFYRESWVVLLRCVSSLVSMKNSIILKELKPTEDSGTLSPTFNILVGLCVEELTTKMSVGADGLSSPTQFAMPRSVEGTVSSNQICVSAMKSFFDPEVSGGRAVFLDKVFYLELLSVFERLLDSSDVSVQIALVQTVGQIISTYGIEYLRDESSDGFTPGSLENISSPTRENGGTIMNLNGSISQYSKLFHTMRFFIKVFDYHVPLLSDGSAALPKLSSGKDASSEQLSLLIVTLEAFARLVAIQSDIAVKLEMLPSFLFVWFAVIRETYALPVAPRALACLKEVFEGSEAACQEESAVSLARIVQRLCKNLLELSKEPNPSTPDSKPPVTVDQEAINRNTLLGVVVLVTLCPRSTLQKQITASLVDAIKGLLESTTLTSNLVALQSVKSLLALSVKPDTSVAGTTFVRFLVPPVALFVHRVAIALHSDQGAAGRQPALEEALRVLLIVYTLAAGDEKKLNVLALLIPTFISILVDLPSDTSSFRFAHSAAGQAHHLSAATLMQLAGQNPAAVRVVIAALPEVARTKLERAFRYEVQVVKEREAQQAGPKIQLKMAF
ncbi:hypothetical protein M427DRAFT_65329 [Gonapodya prolifera JEL478]|uniref:LAA1-like C-terminal TPR repeats domain-containing protein n=1 Tax=Gonapodya prolifera (strain JEL478) TaxID=1344416 RepID=A0A139B0K2_GONPJ|nr:hypothetical protein M427DRAFT_65329 [Gonapodya prolifera JEL478]|eukprot:KXS22333.1 hypothetical protein M427DRAFT_65329 [Gonapodya prolifera JEL478]